MKTKNHCLCVKANNNKNAKNTHNKTRESSRPQTYVCVLHTNKQIKQTNNKQSTKIKNILKTQQRTRKNELYKNDETHTK